MTWAYAAKVAATADTSAPSDWPPGWTFPPEDEDDDLYIKPWPPGWPKSVTGYQLSTAAAASVAIGGGTCQVTCDIQDTDSVDTDDLDGHAIWVRASIDGVIVQIKKETGDTYANYIVYTATNYTGAKYGFQEDIYCDLDADDIGETLTFTTIMVSVAPLISASDTTLVVGAMLAIKERQYAYGITDVWAAGDPTNPAKLIDDTGDTVYTLTQYKAYVNAIADKYVNGAYTGGVSLPPLLDGTYADSATTESELYDLIIAMLETKETGAEGTTTATSFYNSGAESGATGAAALAAATLTYASVGAGYSGGTVQCWNHDYGGGLWECQVGVKCPRWTLTGITAEVEHAVTLYGIAASGAGGLTVDSFNKQGQDVGDDGEYGAVATVTASADTSHLIDDALDVAIVPSKYGTGASNDDTYGFNYAHKFAVLTWSFTHT